MRTRLFAFFLLCLPVAALAQDTTIYPYTAVDVLPDFPGGGAACDKYVNTNLRYPEAEKAAYKEANVTVHFVVEKDGSISNARVIRPPGTAPVSVAFDNEAVRLASAMPAWTIGIKKGKPVRVSRSIWVRFSINTETPKGEAACGRYVPEDSLGYIFDSYKTFRPTFPGGDSVMLAFLEGRLRGSPFYTLEHIGRLYVTFIIDSTGAVCNVAILKPVGDRGKGMHFAAASAVCEMPRWTPAVYKGKNVNTKMTLTLSYGPGSGYPGKEPYFRLELREGTPRDPVEVANEVYTFAQEMPAPAYNFQKYLADSLRYPKAERDAGIEGTVYVSFIVEKNGTITDVQIVKAVPNAPGFSTEVIRVISTMPPWKPGTMNGKPVRIRQTLPVRFVKT